jgi:chromate reductase, NAD(P)H dehydrogenase (quinone)
MHDMVDEFRDALDDRLITAVAAGARIRVLAISGSLRAASLNSAVLRAARIVSSERVRLEIYDRLAELPHFDPDLDGDSVPEVVMDLRARMAAADGVLLCVPEYAWGIPGSFKNALDWTVSSGSLAEKPVAILKVSHPSRGAHAHAALKLVLAALNAELLDDPALSVPVDARRLDGCGELSHPDVIAAVRHAVEALARAIGQRPNDLPAETADR